MTTRNARWVSFGSLKNNETFTPAPGQIGASSVYLKKPNGVCPQVGTTSEGIFYPEDRVIPVKIPEAVVKKYL